MLPEFKLINMNGRLYDPVLARMLSPDNYIQMPDFTQNFNRYSYVLNNPLVYTDPSGELYLWDDIVVGGVGFLFGYVSHGFKSGNWGWSAVGSGALSAASFLLGYYSSGATSASNLVTGLSYSGRSVLSGTISSIMPTINVPISNNIGVNISPGIGFGGSGLTAGLNVSGTYFEGKNSYTIGGGFGNNHSAWGLGASFNNGGFGISYYRTHYGNAIGPDGISNKQVVGGLNISSNKFSFRIENDLMGDRGDRWRSNAAELSLFGGDFVIGTNLYSNDPEGEGQEFDPDGKNMVGNLNKKGYGAWKSGKIYSSPLWVGYRNGGNIIRAGYSHPMVQDRTQNWVHRNGFFYLPFGHQHFYTDYSEFNTSLYMYSGYYNPYSLW